MTSGSEERLKALRGKEAANLLNSNDYEEAFLAAKNNGIYSKGINKTKKGLREAYDKTSDTSETDTTVFFEGYNSERKEIQVKFFVSQDQPFKKILKSFCERNNLEFQNYILELYGENVDLEKSVSDLELFGDEIFDVKERTSFTKTMDKIKLENNNDTDEDIFS